MAWFKRDTDENLDSEKRSVPAGVFTKCPGCRETLLTADLKKQLDVCPKCDHHFLMGTRDRVALMMDEGTIEELDARIESIDPLGFKDSKKYPDRLRAARRQAGHVRRPGGGAGDDRGHPGRGRLLRLRVHGRLDGLGGGREGDPGVRAGPGAQGAGADLLRLGRGAHAGGRCCR